MRKVVGWFGVVIIGCVVIAAFIAYFVLSFDPQSKITVDGFGRQLFDAPWFVKTFLGQDHLWAGWSWFIVDMLIFWGGVGIGSRLASWGLKKNI